MNIKDKLKLGKDVYGVWCVIPSPEVINIISKSGLDFVIVDMEHGSVDYTTAQRMVTSAHSENCDAIIRTPKNDESNILKSLDIGSDGVIIPHVNSIEDVEKCISYSKYPPIGNRGYTPYTRSGGYSVKDGYKEDTNKNSFVGVIIESKEGLDNIESIVSNKYVDMVYIGTYDISADLGCSVIDKKVLDELERCSKIVRDAGKSVGCLFHSKEELNFFKGIGINLLVYSVDSSILYNEFSQIKNWR
jgi:4-hydroxy-2-oxoheptanedioate aldolase